MTIQEEQLLKETFEQKFKEIHTKGLAEGLYSACKVIMDTANSITMSETERLDAIRRFCEVSLGQNKQQ